MAKLKRLNRYKLVHITFLDHYMGPSNELPGPFICEAFGVLAEETKLHYKVVSWVGGGDVNDHNSEGYVILKSTVVEVRRLK